MPKTLLEAKQIFKEYRIGKRTLNVLKGVNFEIREGEYVILFGPSGCGKTTFLNILSGLDSPTSGEVIFDKKKFSEMIKSDFTRYRRSAAGMVFQEFNLIPSMTAYENVALLLAFGNVKEEVRERAGQKWLKKFNLEDRANHHPIEMSGGEQQRTAIARAMIANPRILFVDEPTGNLDSDSAKEVMNAILQLNQKSKKTIVLVTHNSDYFGFAHRIAQMRDGQIVAELKERSFE